MTARQGLALTALALATAAIWFALGVQMASR
jgi:hypothetical protein